MAAATMAGASLIAVECKPSSIDFRLTTKYLDTKADSLEEAIAIVERSHLENKPISVGLLGNSVDIFAEIVEKSKTDSRYLPDAVTDQTSAHDPVNGFLPRGWSVAEWEERRNGIQKALRKLPKPPWPCRFVPCWIFGIWVFL